MEIDKTYQLRQELKRLYKWINIKYKLNLPEIVFTFLPKGKRNCKGWFFADNWLIGKTKYCEINICCEYLDDGFECAEILIHEVGHLYNYINKIKDISRNEYHNKNFKKIAESLGLKVLNRNESIGYGYTELTDVLKDELKNKFKFKNDLFNIKRKEKKGKFSLIKIRSGLYATPKWAEYWNKKIKRLEKGEEK